MQRGLTVSVQKGPQVAAVVGSHKVDQRAGEDYGKRGPISLETLGDDLQHMATIG